MTLDAHNYTDLDFARLRSFYSEGEVVELMAAIGLFNYFNRFNDVLQMEPTKPGLPPKNSPAPERRRSYNVV